MRKPFTGPPFKIICFCLQVVTSRWSYRRWESIVRKAGSAEAGRARTVSPGIAGLIYCPVVRGEQDIFKVSFNEDCI